MKVEPGRGPKTNTDHQANELRKWAEPQLVRQGRLPRVTNGMAGSFDPNGGGTADGGPNQSGTGGMTRNWSNEP